VALPISITLTLFISHLFFHSNKKLSFLQNSILFMIVVIMVRNYTTIMSMELKLLKITEDPFLFIFLLLYREIIVPLVVLFFANTYLTITRRTKRMFLLFSVLAFMGGMDYLSEYFKVIEWVKWNFIYAGIVNAAILMVGLGLAKVLLLKKLECR
jgi:hypothetical protein